MRDELARQLLDIEKIAREARRELRKSDCNIISVANAVEGITTLSFRARVHARRRRDHALRRSGMMTT